MMTTTVGRGGMARRMAAGLRGSERLRTPAWYAASVGGVLLVTWLISLAHPFLQARSLQMVYLLLVLALAVLGGSGPAIAASVLAFLAFDWFFVRPVGHFTIKDPEEWIALLLFLVVAVITGSLAAGLKQRAEEARRRARETTTLYELSIAILGDASLERVLHVIVERLAATLGLRAAAVLLAGPDDGLGLAAQSGASPELVEIVARDAGAAGAFADLALNGRGALHGTRHLARPLTRALGPGDSGRLLGVYAPLALGGRPLGVLAGYISLHGAPLSAEALRLFDAFAAQTALAVGRARLSEEEERARAAAEANRMKSTFLASVSHDLRTPLTAIKTAAGLLQAAPGGADPEIAAGIDREVDRLNRLVGNLLEMSRIEGGSLPPHPTPEDLAELAGAAVQRVLPLLDGRTLEVRIAEDLPLVRVDAAQIDRLLTNLLENAIKFSSPAGAITVHAALHAGEIVLRVYNPGRPIPPAEQARIFDKFYRMQQTAGGPRGTGLGLAICKGIVEAHGGRIWTANEHDGVAFYAALPLDGASAPPRPAVRA